MASRKPGKASPIRLILIAHGSRTPEASREIRALAKRVSAEFSGAYIDVKTEGAFLSLARPSLAESVAKAARAGAAEVLVLPLFLFSGKHLSKDIPALIRGLRRLHAGLKITLLPHIGKHLGFSGLIRQAAKAG